LFLLTEPKIAVIEVNSKFLNDRAQPVGGREDPLVTITAAVKWFMFNEKGFYHSAVIVNSTGTGRTKAAVDLSKSVRAVPSQPQN
jgi:hypothetical protein